MPNGTFSKVEFDCWKQLDYDPNDTVKDSLWHELRTTGDLATNAAENDAALKAEAHYNTPTVSVLDGLGRPVLSRADNGWKTVLVEGVPTQVRQIYDTYTQLDIESKPRSVTDARGNTAVSFKYNMCNVPCYQGHIDSGERWLMANVLNNPCWKKDAKGYVFKNTYDELNRPTTLEVQGGTSPYPIISSQIVSFIEYGEAELNPQTNNLRGQTIRIFDGSGITEITGFDFKGNPLSKTLQLVEDPSQLPNWATPSTVDMKDELYESSIEYDALNRPVKTYSAAAIGMVANITQNTYNEAGLFDTVKTFLQGNTTPTDVVLGISYDAKGQRTAIYYQNNTKTRYYYDPFTFRLIRLLTTRNTGTDVLQDLKYTYDPVGNITQIKDDALQTVFFSNSIVYPAQEFNYDALYRLSQAKGREHLSGAPNWDEFINVQETHPGDETALRNYTENYSYDALGNMTELQHIATGNSWTRTFTYDTASNKLDQTVVGSGTPNTYTYDAHGNQQAMEHLSSMQWNVLDQLQSITISTTQTANYQYNAEGKRIRKVVIHSDGSKKERLYIDQIEIYSEYNSIETLTLQRECFHIMDDKRRIVLVDFPLSVGSSAMTTPLIRCQYSNQIESAALELDDSGAIVSYEEYYPFGGTSCFISATSTEVPTKRYRYSAKEHDEESGLYYFGARYHATWLCRFIAVDPKAIEYLHQSSFVFADNNPIKFIDINGEGTGDDKKTPPTNHTIVPGDTFWDLENKYGLEHGTLKELNPSLNPNNLTIGISINISTPEEKKQANYESILSNITKTIAYNGEFGVINSPDKNLYIRNNKIETFRLNGLSANLFDEFELGFGPQNSLFLGDHPITLDIKSYLSKEVERVTFLLYQKYGGNPKPGDSYTDMKLDFGVNEFVSTAINNHNMAFVGSANISVFFEEDKLSYIISDSKTMYSYWYHLSHSSDHYREPGNYGYGNTYQFYTWTDKKKDRLWFLGEFKKRDNNGRIKPDNTPVKFEFRQYQWK
jgi:RHS repeat-associated protein